MQGTERFKVASFLGCRENKRFFKVQCKETLEFFTMEVVLKESVENPNSTTTQFGPIAEPLPTWGLPFCMELKYVFETQQRRYYILDCGGEACLADMMNDGLPEPTVLFIAAEIALTLEGLHELGVSYNELDLSQLSVDSDGHVVLWREFEGKEYWHISECICGIFGANCGKIGHEVKRQSPNLSPGHWVQISQGIQNDLNSLGILLCHLLTGNADFLNFQSLEEAIISLFITPNTKDFLYGLISGSVQSFEDIKCHPCFRGLDWDEVRSKSLPSPLMASYRPESNWNYVRRGLSKSPSLQNVYTAGISARHERDMFIKSPLSRTHSSSDIHSFSPGNTGQSFSTTGRSGRRNTLGVPGRGGQYGKEAVRLNPNDTKIIQDSKNLGYSQRAGVKSSLNLHRQVFEQNSRHFERPPCMSAPSSPRGSFDTSQGSFVFPPPMSAPCSPRGSVGSTHSGGSGSLSPSSTVVFNNPETNPFHEGYRKRWGSANLDAAFGFYASNCQRNDSNNNITTPRRLSDETDTNLTKESFPARGVYAGNLKEKENPISSSQSDGFASNQPSTFENGVYSSVFKQNESFAISDRHPIVVLPNASTTELTRQGYQPGHNSDGGGSYNAGMYFNLGNPPSETNINQPYFQPKYFEENRMQQQNLTSGNLYNTHGIDQANPTTTDSLSAIGFQRRSDSGNLETSGTSSSFFQTSGDKSDAMERNTAKETANFLFQKHFESRRGSVGSGLPGKTSPKSGNTENGQISDMRQNPTSNISEEQFDIRESSYKAPAANSRNLSSNLDDVHGIQSVYFPNEYTATKTQNVQSQIIQGNVQGSLRTQEKTRSDFNEPNKRSSDHIPPRKFQERLVVPNKSQIHSSLQTTADNLSPPIVVFQQRNSCSPEPLIAIHPSTIPSSNSSSADSTDVSAMACDNTGVRNPFQQISPRRRSSTEITPSTSLPISTSKFENMGQKTSLTRSTSCSDVNERFKSAGNDPVRTGQANCRRSLALRRIPSFEEFRTMRAMYLGEGNDNGATKKDANIVGKEGTSEGKNDSARNKYNNSDKANQNLARTSSLGTTNNPVIQDLLVKYGLDQSPRSSSLKLHQNSCKRPDSENSHPSTTNNNDDKRTKTQDATDTKQRLLNILDDFLAVRTKQRTLSSSVSMYNLKTSFEVQGSKDASDISVANSNGFDMKMTKGAPGKVFDSKISENDSKISENGAKKLVSPRSQHRTVERCKNPTLVVSTPNSVDCVKKATHQNTKDNRLNGQDGKGIEKKNASEKPKRVSKMKSPVKKYECEDKEVRVSGTSSSNVQTIKSSPLDSRKSAETRAISSSSEVETKEGERSRRVSEKARNVSLRHRESLGLAVGKSGEKARKERRSKSFKQALQNEKNEKTSELEENEASNVHTRAVMNGPIKADHSVEIKPTCVERKDLKHFRRMNRRTSSLLSLTDDLCDELDELEAENGIRSESLSDLNENYSGCDRAVGGDDGFLNVESDSPGDRRPTRTESSCSLLSRGSSFHSNFSADSGSVQLDFEESDEEDDDLFYMSEPQETDEKSESDIHRNDSGLGDEIGVGTRMKKRWQDLGHVSSRQSMVVASWRELALKNGKRFEDGQEQENATDEREVQQKSERKTSRGRRISREKQPNAIDCPDCGRAFVVEKDKPSVKSQGPKQTIICYKCQSNRIERKEAIIELVQTEINYGNDFQIVKEEFLAPMQTGGIVSPDNLAKIFLNIQELFDVSSKFCMKIQNNVKGCIDKGDEELCHMNVGGIFVENMELLQAYELYCSRQPEAMRLLESLQKKNDVLRVFLNITCRENPKCRKMDINSFLLAPVQRVTKYPLLLSRIRRATPRWHGDREDLKLAQRKVEEQITKINSLTKSSEMKAKKFQSNLGSPDTVDSSRLKKLASEVLTWTLDEMQLLMHGPLKVLCSEFGGGQSWTKRAMKRSIETHMLFCIRGQNEPIIVDSEDDDSLYFPNTTEITDASLLLLKRKSNGKYILFREEIRLRDCVVYEEMDSDSFGLVHMGKESFLFTTKSSKDARKWMKYLKMQSKNQGKWRRRRNASANIMLKSS